VSWLTAASALFVLSTWKEGLSYIGEILGLDNAPYVLLLIIGILFLFVFFRFSVIISNLKDANIALTQKVAILEYQLHSSIRPARIGRQVGPAGSHFRSHTRAL
jgi:hypothetical protein